MTSRWNRLRRADGGGPDSPPESPERPGTVVSSDARASDWRAPAVCGLLVLGLAIVFGQAVACPFINLDDQQYVYENPHVTHGLNRRDIAWAFTSTEASNWHPLTWISHQLDWQLYGEWAGGHHLSSVLLHTLTALLLFSVLRRMTGRLWPSALVAALFALHPLRVESVVWVAERKDVLSGLFFVLTLGAYVAYCRREKGRQSATDSGLVSKWNCSRPLLYLLVLTMFALGLMAKPMVVTLPCVLLLLDYWPLERFASTPGWKLVLEKLPLLCLSIASCAVTLHVQATSLQMNLLIPPQRRLANSLVAYVGYLGQFFYPIDLAPFYLHPGVTLPAWKVVASAIFLLGVSAIALAWRRKCPYLIVGWLWYLGMLVPVIGFVQIGVQAMADRYSYLPQIGIAMALVWGAVDLSRRWGLGPSAASIVAALVLASLSAVAWMQTGYWQDRETLWRHTLACTSRNFMAHKGLAEVLVERGRTDEAIAEFRSALQITPYDVDLYFATAAALVRAGRDDEAMACYAKGLQAESLDPLTRARRRKESAPEPQAMEPTEHEAYVHYNMGVALDSAGRTRAAAAHYEKALQFRPVFALAHFNLANALADLGNVREAIAHYEQALRQEPGYAKAHYNLAWLLATADPAQGGDPGQAVAVAERASRLAGGDLPVVLDVLAVAYAAANRFPEAIATAEKAVEAASTVGAAGLARQIEARLRLYRQGRVYRQAYCPAK